jgi:ubiquinone/menaquinone biosynthesis C-methylase UbiE
LTDIAVVLYIAEMRYHSGSADVVSEPYEPFANVAFRNAIQQRFEVPTLAALLRLPTGGDLLEVGCGRGVAFGPLSATCNPASLTAIDVDAALVAEARAAVVATGIDASVFAADVRSLPFPADSFDLVVDFGTCYHIADPECALVEISRVLRPGGLFVHESVVAQLVSHPHRFRGRGLPWTAVPELRPTASAIFWASRRKARVLRGRPDAKSGVSRSAERSRLVGSRA